MIIESFFLEEIVRSSDYQNIKVGYHSRIYLSKIMTKYSTQEGCDKLNKTIASLYIESIMEDKKTVRFQKYKEIGDTALAKVGLFPESISRVLSKDYLFELISVAYAES